MKKFISAALTVLFGMTAFAFEPGAMMTPVNGVKSYIKTDYTVASKFGEYFRTPNAKFQHVFNTYGQEIENSSLTLDGKVMDKITFEYDSKGNVTTQTGYDDAENVLWKVINTYDKSGLKTEESEYDAKDNLSSKSIFKYTGKNLTEETLYNGLGKIIWKNIYTYEDDLCKSTSSYYASGELESKKTFKYNDNKDILEIYYYDEELKFVKKELYRYDANNVLTEIATYDSDNTLYLRKFFKYDSKGNVLKITTYAIGKKFGTTVNELAGMSDFTYTY
ncbi:MAG: hypothetical protein KBS84_03395 [Treponema sp.]|nr:hypothetical protein [Candidatus Treponema scatequi]